MFLTEFRLFSGYGRSDRNKPDQSSRNSSHGPLSTIRAAIKRTSIRTSSQSEPRRERSRPDITVIAAEPIGPSPWYPGSPGNCATSAGLGLSYPRTLWRIDEPVAAEPPPSYEQVIREINQHPVPRQHPSRRSTTTTSTQTEFDQDTENIETRSADADFTSLRGNTPVTVQRPVKPSRPAVCLIPIRPEESEEPLISIESNSSREQSVQTNTNVVERPIPRPRSLGNFKILFEELQSETSEGEGEESGVLRGLTLCQNPLTEDNFANQETMGDNSGHSFLARIKAFETQTDSENSAGNTRPSKRPEVAPRSFGPKPAVVHGKPTVAPKPSVADKNSGGSDKVVETKPVAAERQGPIPLPKPQKMPAAARPKPEPPKKPKPSISAESKQSNGSNSTLDAGEKALSATVTPRERPTDKRNQVPVPAPRPTVAKRTISENRDPSSTAFKPPASRPSVLPLTKTSMMQVEESSSNKYAASPDKISNLQDLISFDDDDVVPAIPTGDNVTSLVTVDPFQTLPRGQMAPTDSTSSRPPLLRKPTVIRIPNKQASEDIESPPPLPVETPVGSFVAQRPNIVPKTAVEDLCDVPRPVASQPLTVPGKVPPARPPPAKAGPARPPPPKISASATQLRHSSSELGINNTAGKSSPRAQSKNRPKSQVFQKKRPELPPRPAPGHPLYNKYMLPVPHGIAKCDVNSRVPGELSFQRGEVLILQQQTDQSLQCQKGFDTGKVPSSHLKIITPLDEEVVKGTNKKPFTSEQFGENSAPHAIVLHDFTADQNDELNLKSGDTVYLLEKLDKDWFSGKCKGHTGIFPANFVKVIVDLPIDDSQESSVKKVAFKSASLARGPRCVARFDFEGDQADELTFYEGDVIALKEYVSEEWARGQLKGRSGIFPLNFVEIVEDLPASEQQQIQNSPLSPGSDILAGGKAGDTTSCSQVGNSNSQWCEALYDFKAEAADDLPFKRGDRILITEQLDSEWCKGKLNGREGTFPTVFVQMCSGEASAAKQQPSENKRGKAKALYDFVGENKDELDLKVGDMITIFESIDADWLKGELQGKEGIFPRNFVQILQDPL
ncbi:SH3 domain-containing protein 19 isoform X2 [Carcharodon carcharias]|uniref:SH3 domain-containing protein 19 isoform X2 n=1 Tax=Carcharodon carcharias TaxID=13397 RepID=UPI001B7E4DA4|nr:SH3 domain-containing protein 19 isoform X2 [Carcharodon carcharias]